MKISSGIGTKERRVQVESRTSTFAGQRSNGEGVGASSSSEAPERARGPVLASKLNDEREEHLE